MKIKYNLKYGQQGLFIRIWSGKNYSTKNDILISKDYPKIFEFLGLDYTRWEEGFDTLEDIFDFAMTSSLFNVEMFQLSKLNKINRERNIKRASYMAFLEYIEGKDNHPEYNANLVSIAKENVIEIIREGFPEANIDLHLAEINYHQARKVLVNAKFNGNIIKEKYGLKGKELGESIKTFKKDIEGMYEYEFRYFDDFNSYILDTDVDRIYEDFELANGIK